MALPYIQKTKKLTKGEITRLNILRAAEDIFSEYGYSATRLESIAEAVGVRQAALFYHFPSKQKLFSSVMRDIHDSIEEASHACINPSDCFWNQLMALVRAWLDFMVSRPTAARLILRDCADMLIRQTPQAEGPMEELYPGEILKLMREIIAGGIAAGEFAEVNAMYLVNLLSGSILHYVCNPEQLGMKYVYQPDDPAEIACFMGILRKTAYAVLEVRVP